MANNNSNTAFSGFPGGHDSIPGTGNIAPAATGFANTGNTGTSTLGANLPHVNPNDFQGTVHWGPEKTLTGSEIGQTPLGNAGTGSN